MKKYMIAKIATIMIRNVASNPPVCGAAARVESKRFIVLILYCC